jgi:hypothetical protein
VFVRGCAGLQVLKETSIDSPFTKTVAAEILSLPMFPQLIGEQQDRVGGRNPNFISIKCGERVESEAVCLAGKARTES